MLYITWSNAGGMLDRRSAKNEAEAAAILIEMVRAAGHLCHGDRLEIQEVGRENEGKPPRKLGPPITAA